ncbi:MAG: hypothetical protein IBX44_03695 [Sulfurospirillum sp.]|nr:hypothetical protein [Sulfurospirillum sp.]
MDKKAVKNYIQNQKNTRSLRDPRLYKILAFAKTYGVAMYENEVLARELFDLQNKKQTNKHTLEQFMQVLQCCQMALSKAQMSS